MDIEFLRLFPSSFFFLEKKKAEMGVGSGREYYAREEAKEKEMV